MGEEMPKKRDNPNKAKAGKALNLAMRNVF